MADLHDDVVLANHIVYRAGLVTAFGHVSARIPATDTFLFPTRASPALARRERLLVLDLDGRKQLRAFSVEEASQAREEFDATGPMSRAWDFYAALAENRL